jgi:hypothetical protein
MNTSTSLRICLVCKVNSFEEMGYGKTPCDHIMCLACFLKIFNNYTKNHVCPLCYSAISDTYDRPTLKEVISVNPIKKALGLKGRK